MSLPDHCHRQVRIHEAGDLLVAKGVAAELAHGLKLPEIDAHRFSLILTELATNLVRYAPAGGTMLLRRLTGAPGLECICHDRGPGIADIAGALRDGESLGHGLGFGLGAVRRLSDEFAIHSEPAVGTAILARVGGTGGRHAAVVRSGAVMLPMEGQTDCGDGWLCRADGLVAVIDGLGHGPEASAAARLAEAQAMAGDTDPPRVMADMHAALRGTVGAVAMVLVAGGDAVRFIGVGNIAGAVIGTDRLKRLHSGWGVVGSNLPRTEVSDLPWSSGDVLLLHSDGIAGATEVFAARRLRYVEPTLAAAIVLRDAVGKVDDRTVLVLRR